MEFKEKVDSVYLLIKEKMATNQGDVAIKLINGLLDIVEKRYTKDFLSFLSRTGVGRDLDLWTKYSQQFISQIDGLEIDPWKNVVSLDLNGEILSATIFDTKEYIKTIENLSESEAFLVACYLGKPNNSKVVQIYHNFLK